MTEEQRRDAARLTAGLEELLSAGLIRAYHFDCDGVLTLEAAGSDLVTEGKIDELTERYGYHLSDIGRRGREVTWVYRWGGDE